jgi:hypothetical protein
MNEVQETLTLWMVFVIGGYAIAAFILDRRNDE